MVKTVCNIYRYKKNKGTQQLNKMKNKFWKIDQLLPEKNVSVYFTKIVEG